MISSAEVEPVEMISCDLNTVVLDKNGVVPVLFGEVLEGERADMEKCLELLQSDSFIGTTVTIANPLAERLGGSRPFQVDVIGVEFVPPFPLAGGGKLYVLQRADRQEFADSDFGVVDMVGVCEMLLRKSV